MMTTKTLQRTSINKGLTKSAKAMTQWNRRRVISWIIASSKNEAKRPRTCPITMTTCWRRSSSSTFWLKTLTHRMQIGKNIGTKKLATMPDFAAGTVHMPSSINSVKKTLRSSSWCRLSRVVSPKRRQKLSRLKLTLRCHKPPSVSQRSSSRFRTKERAIIESNTHWVWSESRTFTIKSSNHHNIKF